ncbi:MAG: inositol monophosphatase family protein [Planctomycetes bacterium]|nr:inositol monophosphatase family protein [Planctomycetota bacterium]
MGNDDEELRLRLELACSAAHEAGQLTLDFFHGRNYVVDRKEDRSPVTEADRTAEALLRDRILAAFPHDAIVGEELGVREGASGYRWILDPIDGTTAFVSGVPLFGTLIGVERQQRSVVGVINMPALDECVYAASGLGAWHRSGPNPPRPALVSHRDTLADGLFVTSQIDLWEHQNVWPVFQELQRRAYITRTWGDCFGYLLVATGRAEVMVDPVMKVWDAAALQPILEESGGSFTDWSGVPTIHGGEGIATNGLVLDEVLRLTRGSKKQH